MSVADILVWAGFFETVAQIGATLAGLIFVGLTISLEHILGVKGYLSRAFAALFLQFETLLIGLFGLVPGQPAWALGGEYIVMGCAFFAGIAIFARNFPEDEQSDVLGSRGLRIYRAVLTDLATLLPIASGLSLILGWRYALYLLIPTIVACAYVSIGYAWVFAVEIPRRRQESDKTNSKP
jgi:hypothetical protein